MSLQETLKSTESAMEYIMNHDKKEDIISMYQTGPPEGLGFMWCSGSDFHTSEQQYAFEIMKKWILDSGFDSSAYGSMHRCIQYALCNIANKT